MRNTTQDDPPPPQLGGCLKPFVIGVGIVLLLPGLCALALVGFDPRAVLTDSMLGVLLLCLAIAAGGIALIWAAVKSG
jgi:hypothetical protein